MLKEEIKFESHKVSAKNQYLATIIVNLLPLGYGVTCGWSSPNVILLTSNETPLPSGPITMEQASWVASYICVGALFGNMFFGFITNKFGRKIPLIIIAIPTIVRDSLQNELMSNPQMCLTTWFIYFNRLAGCSCFSHKTFTICTHRGF